jgi:hypothetical protein
MVEAHQLGFNNVLWVDAACVPLGDMHVLFDMIGTYGALLNWTDPYPVRRHYIFPQTRRLLKELTGTDVFESPYINTVVFGLKMNSPAVQRLIRSLA